MNGTAILLYTVRNDEKVVCKSDDEAEYPMPRARFMNDQNPVLHA